jgi:GNAT superfamily N-acetyltransferase
MPGFSKKLIARSGGQIAGTLRLATKKPWAIDASYFTLVARPLYLVGMAVHPRHQGKGVGRALMEQAVMMARAWPGDAIRLDAWDATAGASGFYEKCGFRMAGHAKYKGAPLVYYEMLISRPTNPR